MTCKVSLTSLTTLPCLGLTQSGSARYISRECCLLPSPHTWRLLGCSLTCQQLILSCGRVAASRRTLDDITDYTAVHGPYGHLMDVETIIREAKARGMRVLADLVINHGSSEHEWFKESRKSVDTHKRD